MPKVKKEAAEKELTYESIVEDLNKAFKDNAFELGGHGLSEIKAWISTGSWLVDRVCGDAQNPGIACPRVIYAWGPKHSGKTMLLTNAMASVHRMGGFTIFADSEGAFYYEAAERIGWTQARNIWVKPLYVYQGFELFREAIIKIRAVMRSKKISDNIPILAGWDGISFVQSEVEYKDGGEPMAHFARELHRSTKLFNRVLSENNAIFWCINQPSTKIGTVSYMIPKGGERLSSFCSIEMKHWMGSDIYFDDELIGNYCVVDIIKNRVTGRRARIPVCTRIKTGIDDILTLLMYFDQKGKVSKPKGSAWKSLKTPGGEISFQNEKGFLDRAEALPELVEWMKKEVLEGGMI